jgi:glycosyltransferase involved in cell wall biosynthesis
MNARTILDAAISAVAVNGEPDLLDSEKPRPSLTIVIPALNEQASIASIIERCVAARDRIEREGGIRSVEIIVVNDGSTDDTGPIAEQIAATTHDVKVVHFPKNRGYGAALKEGFRHGRGEYVAFLDADGTCDPLFFAEMCAVLQNEAADIVLGSRMGTNSQMPTTRRIGNRVFAFLLGLLSGKAVTDTASGMRVIRRRALARLYPLPDGLQFTPAMSARAVLDGMAIHEVDMTYAERVGESKLHPFRDGVRFLAAIGSALLLFRPSRAFDLAACFCFAMAVLWGLYPIEHYWTHGALQEGMIFRLLLCSLLLTCTFVLLAGSVLANDIVSLVHRRNDRRFATSVLDRLLAKEVLIAVTTVAPIIGLVIVWPGLLEWIWTKQTEMHWSRAMLAVLLLQIAVCAGVTAILRCVISLWRTQSHGTKP